MTQYTIDKGGRHRKVKTACPKGHEYTPENLKIDKFGYKRCRECVRVSSRQIRAEEKLDEAKSHEQAKKTLKMSDYIDKGNL